MSSDTNPNEYINQRLVDFLAKCPEQEIVGFPSPSGVGASQGRMNTPWTLSIELFAWQIDNGPIHSRQPFDTKSTFRSIRTIPEEEIESMRMKVPFPSVVRFNARVAPLDSEFPRYSLLTSDIDVIQDQSLFDAGAEAMNQTVFVDPKLGRFRDVLAMGYWALPIEYNFRAILIKFSAQNAAEFDLFRARIPGLSSIISRAKRDSRSLIHECLYTFWRENMYYDGLPMLDVFQFDDLLKVEIVELTPDGMTLGLSTHDLMDGRQASILCALDGTPLRAEFL